MSINTTLTSKLTTRDVLANQVFSDTANQDINFNGLDETQTYNATSTPPGTVEAYFEQALTAGSATIDLTAVPAIQAVLASGSGLKPRAIKFRCKGTNANPITIAKGASNGYAGLGAAFSLTQAPGQSALLNLLDGSSAIGSTNKTFDLAGTGSQVMQVGVVFG